eukprot:4379486-Pleurochrysis_carterae.AAC.1
MRRPGCLSTQPQIDRLIEGHRLVSRLLSVYGAGAKAMRVSQSCFAHKRSSGHEAIVCRTSARAYGNALVRVYECARASV